MKGMYENLPQKIKIGKEKYKVNSDFRIFIELETKMQDGNEKEAIVNALNKFYYPAFYKIIEENKLKEAVDKFVWFYMCGKKEQKLENKNVETTKNQERLYDYEFDSQVIWGAYYDRGIDLTTDRLHWWKFKALWNSMPKDCKLNRVMSYRGYNGKDEDMLKLKDLYKLPLTKSELNEKERLNKIYETLKKIDTSQK